MKINKKKLLFLFFILGITPFARSCDATLGFPLPAASDILSYNLLEYFSNPLFYLSLTLNLLILSFFAAYIIRYKSHSPWIGSFLNALGINIFINWSLVLLLLLKTENKFLLSVAGKYWEFMFSYATWLPDKIFYSLKRAWLDNDMLYDTIHRIWFVITTYLLTILLVWVGLLRKREN